MKTGQTVKITSGRDKGKTGKIIQVFPKKERVVVEGVNKMFKHVKTTPNTGQSQAPSKGDRVEFFGPIHMSNVKLVEEAAPATPKPKKASKKSAATTKAQS